MPLPPIAVEIAPPDQSADLVQMLLDACSRAANSVECLPADRPAADGVSALAIVVWEPKGEGVRIQVGAKRGESSGDWVNRRIGFETSDAASERWTTAGFVVGTLASRFLKLAEPSEPEPAVAATQPEAPSEAPEPAQPRRKAVAFRAWPPRRIWLDAATLGGPLFDRGPWRYGGMVGVAYLGENWPVFAYSSLRQSWRPRDSNDIVARLTEGDFGVGLPVTQGADWNLDLTAAGTFERFYVDLRGDSLKRAPVRHWVAGARARLELSWSPTNAVGGVVGAGLAWWSHNTAFEVNEVNVASQQSVVGEMTLAVRFTLR